MLYLLILFLHTPFNFQEIHLLKERCPLENVEIKGFLYKNEEGVIIIADNPDIKSCCVGHLERNPNQLICQGSFQEPLEKGLVILTGNLVIKENKLVLDQSQILSKKVIPIKTLCLSGFLVLVLFVVNKKNKQKKLFKTFKNF